MSSTTTTSTDDGNKRRKTSASLPWPATCTDPVPKFKKSGLLYGLDEALWLALAHVEPSKFDTDQGKQVVVREALNRLHLGWVATNTTPFRLAIAKKFDQAKKIHASRHWESPNPLPAIPQILIEDTVLGKDGECQLSFVSTDPSVTMDISDANAANVERIKSSIDKYGVAVIRGAFPKVTSRAGEKGKRIKIQNTTGNGIAGTGSYYADTNSPYWKTVQSSLLRCFLNDEEAHKVELKRKAIILKYGSGAENWAHRDGNDDGLFPYQATVMLSNPGFDFTGGEFYVAKRDDNKEDGPRIIRTLVEFQNQGDMVLFRADKDGEYDHGMLTVKKGSADECQRIAVGLLQKS